MILTNKEKNMFSFRSFVLVSAFVLAGCNGCTSDSAPDASVDVTVETAEIGRAHV